MGRFYHKYCHWCRVKEKLVCSLGCLLRWWHRPFPDRRKWGFLVVSTMSKLLSWAMLRLYDPGLTNFHLVHMLVPFSCKIFVRTNTLNKIVLHVIHMFEMVHGLPKTWHLAILTLQQYCNGPFFSLAQIWLHMNRTRQCSSISTRSCLFIQCYWIVCEP